MVERLTPVIAAAYAEAVQHYVETPNSGTESWINPTEKKMEASTLPTESKGPVNKW
jgi:hypothetical protein